MKEGQREDPCHKREQSQQDDDVLASTDTQQVVRGRIASLNLCFKVLIVCQGQKSTALLEPSGHQKLLNRMLASRALRLRKSSKGSTPV